MIRPHQSEAYTADETLECGCPIDGDERCESCCDHDDVCTDERICLICDKDLSESMASNKETLPKWLVQTANGEQYGYFTLDILLCDLSANRGEKVTILELVPGIRVHYRPITEELLRKAVA